MILVICVACCFAPKSTTLVTLSEFWFLEDGASSHSAHTSQEMEKQGIPKLDWVPDSPDLNPI